MQSRIQKWGNSLAVRIPTVIAKQLHLHSGSQVNLEIKDGQIIVKLPQYDLDTMINAITPNNQHHLALDDASAGNEEW